MKLFWTCLAIDCIAFLVLAGFFLDGLSHGSEDYLNLTLWCVLVGIPGAILWGGLRLKAKNRPGAATAILALLAVPTILASGWMGLILLMFAMHPGGHH